MSQAEFEYECSRALLLGTAAPTWDEFSKRKKDEHEIALGPEVDVDEPETLNDLQEQGENIKRTVGGLDELNTILASTQVKINKFKSVCGSFTNLMKLRSWKAEKNDVSGGECSSSVPVTPCKKTGGVSSDVEAVVVDQVDRLDSLLGKAERAEISMSVQNKQMKSYLRK